MKTSFYSTKNLVISGASAVRIIGLLYIPRIFLLKCIVNVTFVVSGYIPTVERLKKLQKQFFYIDFFIFYDSFWLTAGILSLYVFHTTNLPNPKLTRL